MLPDVPHTARLILLKELDSPVARAAKHTLKWSSPGQVMSVSARQQSRAFGRTIGAMLSKVLVQRCVQWLSPVNVHPNPQSRAWRCASGDSSNDAAELAQSMRTQSGFPAASSHPTCDASSFYKTFRELSPQRKAEGLVGGLQRIAGSGPRNKQHFVSAGIPSVQRLRALFEECSGDQGTMQAFPQVERQTPMNFGEVLPPFSQNTPCPPCSASSAVDCSQQASAVPLGLPHEGNSMGCAGEGWHTEQGSVLQESKPSGRQ